MNKQRQQAIITLPKILTFVVLIAGALMIHACASSQAAEQTNNQDKKLNEGEESFAFYDTTGGQQTYWEAIFKNQKLSELYKNGSLIPDSLISDYKDLVYNRIDRVSGDNHKLIFRFHDFPFDSTYFKHKKHFKNHLMWMMPDSCFPFNSKKFHPEIDSLKKEMEFLKHFKFNFKFDSSKFRENMKEMMKGLKHLHFDSSDFKVNMKEFDKSMKKFEKGMKEFQKEMKNKKFNFDIDLSGLNDQMAELNERIGHLKLDMSGVNKVLQKYNHFEEELRKEMVNDGVIKKGEDNVEIKIESGLLKVNGKKVPDNLFKKYKKLYKDIMGKDWHSGEEFDLE